MGCIAYTFVGSAKDVTLGPTAIMSLMVNSVANPSKYGANYAVALTLVCGCIQLIMSMFRLGESARVYLSISVGMCIAKYESKSVF